MKFLGNRSHDDVLRLIEQSAFLVFPSEWYEAFPLTLLESMAVGRAAVASDLGPRREMVIEMAKRDSSTAAATFRTLRPRCAASSRTEIFCATMGAAARDVYLAKYTPATNYQILIRIYEEAVDRSRGFVGDRTSDNEAATVEARA